ncbi:unnamed protein product [Linum trigynum]|uniref:Retrotransposon Copia-like N-terminal domain-containing protein n=1 Tax=Linum trigynum TaxID=586398 RepID=A0AAV2FEK4_9ROSI
MAIHLYKTSTPSTRNGAVPSRNRSPHSRRPNRLRQRRNQETLRRHRPTDPNHRDWARSNATVLLWLLHTLTDPIAQTFYQVETAAELWEQLEKSFGRPNPARLIELKHSDLHHPTR